MFEIRIRVLDVGGGSFLGIVEGFPEILSHATSAEQAETDAANALAERLRRLQDREATRIDWDDFPTVQSVRLYLTPRPG